MALSATKQVPGAGLLSRWRSGLTAEGITCAISAVLLIWLVLYPLLVLFVGSLRTDLPMRPGVFTLANFSALFADPANLAAIVNIASGYGGWEAGRTGLSSTTGRGGRCGLA